MSALAAGAAASSPWWGPAAIAAGGALATSAFNLWQGSKTRDYNERMSNTAHQRQVKDLRAAGLNPVLSAGHPGAAVPAQPVPHVDSKIAGDAINTGLAAKQRELVDAQIRDVNAAAQLKETEGHIMLRTTDTRIDMIREGLYKFRAEIDHLQRMYPGIEKEIQSRISKMAAEENLSRQHGAHSALDLSRAKSESRFYEGAGGDVEHWLKMLGIQIPNTINIMRGIPGKRAPKTMGERHNSDNYRSFERAFKSRKQLEGGNE